MGEEKALILGILLHFVGDYLNQNNWMAQNKTKDWKPALVHALIYSVPFLYLVPDFYIWLPIFVTHYFIDRYRLAQYWIKLVNWNWKSTNWGFSEQTPPWLSNWLLFIVDNTFHIIINTLTIIYFYDQIN